MATFKCVQRCFVNGRFYEPGETLRAEADAVPHFVRTGAEPEPKAPVPKVPRRKPAKSRKADILE